jgi:Bardet-Biedl syndrome 2 protein
VLPKLVTVGKFDGVHPSIACATSSDNLLLHSPHRRSNTSELETRTINLNRTISALAAGDLEAKADRRRDILLIGSTTSLQGYDVESNSDVFFKEVADGVNALAFGSLASVAAPMAMVGGNCSLQGFDARGAEVFWTVTGDNVSALTFRDTKDGKQEVT